MKTEEESFFDRAYVTASCLFSFCVCFPYYISSYAFGLWVLAFVSVRIHDAVTGQFSLPDYRSRALWPVYALLLFFVVSICSSLYAAEPTLVFHQIFGKRLIMLILPVCALVGLKSLPFTKLLRCYIYGAYTFILFSFLFAIWHWMPLDEAMRIECQGDSFNSIFAVHRIYADADVVIGNIVFIYLLIIRALQQTERRVLYTFPIFSVLYILITASRTAMGVTLVVLLFYVFYFARHQKRLILPFLLTVVIVGGLAVSVPNRFQKSVHTILSHDTKFDDARFTIWDCARSCSHSTFFTGFGTNNYIKPLTQEYAKRGLDWPYGTHNAYLESWMETGWMGVIALALIVFSIPFSAGRERWLLSVPITMAFAFTFCIESMLGRQNGIFMFTFFAVFLGVCNSDKVRSYFPSPVRYYGLSIALSILTLLSMVAFLLIVNYLYN